MCFDTAQYIRLIQEGELDKASNYRASCIPDTLYKFVSLTNDENENEKRLYSLENSLLWAAPASQQNDPYEFSGMYLNHEEMLTIGFTEESISCSEKMIRDSFNIISFCGNALNNMPMWANYANNHAGFCLKYQVSNKRIVRNVMYEPHRVPFTKMYSAFLHNARMAREKRDDKALKNTLFYSAIMQEMYNIKHKSWEYENEYRILYPPETNMLDKGQNVPINIIGLTLTGIYSGYMCQPILIDRLTAISDKLNVPAYRCRLSDTEYAVFEE